MCFFIYSSIESLSWIDKYVPHPCLRIKIITIYFSLLLHSSLKRFFVNLKGGGYLDCKNRLVDVDHSKKFIVLFVLFYFLCHPDAVFFVLEIFEELPVLLNGSDPFLVLQHFWGQSWDFFLVDVGFAGEVVHKLFFVEEALPPLVDQRYHFNCGVQVIAIPLLIEDQVEILDCYSVFSLCNGVENSLQLNGTISYVFDGVLFLMMIGDAGQRLLGCTFANLKLRSMVFLNDMQIGVFRGIQGHSFISAGFVCLHTPFLNNKNKYK